MTTRRLPVPYPRPIGLLKWAVYTFGFRPRGVLYSPSLAVLSASREEYAESFREGLEREERARAMRGRAAWHMPLGDVIIGHRIGFDYPMNGDERPEEATS